MVMWSLLGRRDREGHGRVGERRDPAHWRAGAHRSRDLMGKALGRAARARRGRGEGNKTEGAKEKSEGKCEK